MVTEADVLSKIDKSIIEIKNRQARFASYNYWAFPLNEDWRPIVFEKNNLTLAAGKRITLLDVPNESGWFSGAICYVNSPLFTVIFTTDMFTITGNIYQAYDYGLTEPNPTLPWISVYDLLGSRYVVNMTPNPEVPYRRFFKVEIYNPGTTSITITRLVVTRTAVEYTKPIFGDLRITRVD